MAEWQISEFSKLTNVSVRMLRHYDKLGLLKPSNRAENGYRYYTENNLATLQQIMALKYFGFQLSKIKSILEHHQNIYAHLKMQQQVLQSQADHLHHVCHLLSTVLEKFSEKDTPDYHYMINLIEGYKMSKHLKDKIQKNWKGQLSEEQIEDMLFIYENTTTPKERELLDKYNATYIEWIKKIDEDKAGDPTGPNGTTVSKLLKTINAIETRRQTPEIEHRWIKLNKSINHDVDSGKISDPPPLSPKAHVWLWRAGIAYTLNRLNTLSDTVLDNLANNPKGKEGKTIAEEWKSILSDFGPNDSPYYLAGVFMWDIYRRDEAALSELKSDEARNAYLKFRQQTRNSQLENTDVMIWLKQALREHAK